jgi:hypothetical protein
LDCSQACKKREWREVNLSVPSQDIQSPALATKSGFAFALGFVGLAVVAAILSGTLPISFAFAAVFLFAGPHNWLELRYALGRMPARAGKLRAFFLVSAVGIAGLGGAYALLPYVMTHFSDPQIGTGIYWGWSTAFLFWTALLVWMRSNTNPRFDSGWVWPVVCFASAGVSLNPIALPVAMVYLHPLMALWLLDLELRRSRPTWRRTYRIALGSVPVFLFVLWWQFRDTSAMSGSDQMTLAFAPASINADAMADQVGAFALPDVSPYFLISAHTFLEMVHYGVWVILIPLIGMRSWPWQLATIPAVRRGRWWSRAIGAFLLSGLLVVGVLWICFGLDFETTRRVYFSVAMLHVLAEVPFLLRMI